MKKIALLGIGVVLLVSCASMPSYEGDESTLLVIPIENTYENTQEVFGHYELTISSLETEEVVLKRKIPTLGKYILIKNLEPGKYFISASTFYYRSDSEGSSLSFPALAHSFELVPGHISFTRFIYGQRNYWNDDKDSYYMNRKLRLDDEGIYQKQLLEELLQKFPEEMESWEVLSFTGIEY